MYIYIYIVASGGSMPNLPPQNRKCYTYVAARLRPQNHHEFSHCGATFVPGHKSKVRSRNHIPKLGKPKLSLDFHVFSLHFIVFSSVCWFWKSWEGEWARASVPQICKMHRKFSETAATPSTNLKVGVQLPILAKNRQLWPKSRQDIRPPEIPAGHKKLSVLGTDRKKLSILVIFNQNMYFYQKMHFHNFRWSFSTRIFRRRPPQTSKKT